MGFRSFLLENLLCVCTCVYMSTNKVDPSELTIVGFQKLLLELETRPWTEQFKSHEIVENLKLSVFSLLKEGYSSLSAFLNCLLKSE